MTLITRNSINIINCVHYFCFVFNLTVVALAVDEVERVCAFWAAACRPCDQKRRGYIVLVLDSSIIKCVFLSLCGNNNK